MGGIGLGNTITLPVGFPAGQTATDNPGQVIDNAEARRQIACHLLVIPVAAVRIEIKCRLGIATIPVFQRRQGCPYVIAIQRQLIDRRTGERAANHQLMLTTQQAEGA